MLVSLHSCLQRAIEIAQLRCSKMFIAHCECRRGVADTHCIRVMKPSMPSYFGALRQSKRPAIQAVQKRCHIHCPLSQGLHLKNFQAAVPTVPAAPHKHALPLDHNPWTLLNAATVVMLCDPRSKDLDWLRLCAVIRPATQLKPCSCAWPASKRPDLHHDHTIYYYDNE